MGKFHICKIKHLLKQSPRYHLIKNMFSGSQMWFCVSMQIMFWRKTKGFFWGKKGCIQVLLHKKYRATSKMWECGVKCRHLGQNKSNVGVFSKAVFELFKLLPVPVFVYSTVNCIHRQWFMEVFQSHAMIPMIESCLFLAQCHLRVQSYQGY